MPGSQQQQQQQQQDRVEVTALPAVVVVPVISSFQTPLRAGGARTFKLMHQQDQEAAAALLVTPAVASLQLMERLCLAEFAARMKVREINPPLHTWSSSQYRVNEDGGDETSAGPPQRWTQLLYKCHQHRVGQGLEKGTGLAFQHKTLTAAMLKCASGDYVRLEGGLYLDEATRIRQDVTIFTSQPRTHPVVLRSNGPSPALEVANGRVALSGISLQRSTPGSTLVIHGGNIVVSNCDISSRSGIGLDVSCRPNDTDRHLAPTLKVLNSSVHDCESHGVRVNVDGFGRVLLEGNSICNNRKAGIEVTAGVTNIKSNNIQDNGHTSQAAAAAAAAAAAVPVSLVSPAVALTAPAVALAAVVGALGFSGVCFRHEGCGRVDDNFLHNNCNQAVEVDFVVGNNQRVSLAQNQIDSQA